MGGSAGRLIPTSDRSLAIQLIVEACKQGARKRKACEILGVSLRTLERWEKEYGQIDKRKNLHNAPANKLTEEEWKMILNTANSEIYRDLPRCKIVPILEDNNVYIASESSFYRVLREANQLTHRGNTKPQKHSKPKSFVAENCNQIWTWDVSKI